MKPNMDILEGHVAINDLLRDPSDPFRGSSDGGEEDIEANELVESLQWSEDDDWPEDDDSIEQRSISNFDRLTC